MRIDQATHLAIRPRERWETGLRVVERTGDQLRVLRPFQRSGCAAPLLCLNWGLPTRAVLIIMDRTKILTP